MVKKVVKKRKAEKEGQKKTSDVDNRFDHIASDPKYRRMREDERRVTIDSRFEDMFSEPKFTLEYSSDKRGRPIAKSSVDQLNKFYELEPTTSKEDIVEEVEDEDSEDEKEIRIDLARGDGNLSSSDDEQEDVQLDYDVIEFEQPWAELDSNAPMLSDATNRLAVCNIDWDKVNAKDIFILFNSFKPALGSINVVTIYTSDFGEERMSKEEVQGPQLKEEEEESSGDEEHQVDTEEKQQKMNELSRKYEMEKLQYYYAIVECDCAITADAIYKECDGAEYELSCTKLDLRFIPDDVTFEDRPLRDKCDDVSNLKDYKPQVFRNSALTDSKVKLTWDEPDLHRENVAKQAFSTANLDSHIFNDLIGSGSEDEHEQNEAHRQIWNEEVGEIKELGEQKISMQNLDEINSDDGMEDSDEDIINKSGDLEDLEEEEEVTLTPGERKKQRRKERKAALRAKKKAKLGGNAVERNIHTEELQLLTEETNEKEDFKVDLRDHRFEAVFDSHLFNLDPSNAAFKQTPGIKAIVDEKLRRHKTKIEEPPEENVLENEASELRKPDVKNMIDSLREKTKTLAKPKKKKVGNPLKKMAL